MSVVGTLGGMGTLPNPNAMNPLLQQFIQMQMLQQQALRQQQPQGGFMPISAQQQPMQSAAPNAPAQPNSAAPQQQTPPPQQQTPGALPFSAAPQIPQMPTGNLQMPAPAPLGAMPQIPQMPNGAPAQRQPAAGDKSLRVDEEGTQSGHRGGGIFGMFDGLNERMSAEDASGHTPMDQLSLAASLISAGQPSWNVNRDPGGDVAQAFANYADRGEARLERANARREHKDELAWQGEAHSQQRDEWRRARAEQARIDQAREFLIQQHPDQADQIRNAPESVISEIIARQSAPAEANQYGVMTRYNPQTGQIEAVRDAGGHMVYAPGFEETRQWQEHMTRLQHDLSVSDRYGRPTDGEVRQWYNTYQNNQRNNSEILSQVRGSIGYAQQAVRSRGVISGMNNEQMGVHDSSLLRAAARLATGPGVLTQAEVNGTLSPTVRLILNQGEAFLSGSHTYLTPQEREAVARFVSENAVPIQRAMWDEYGNQVDIAAPRHWNLREMGIRAPAFPHPDDIDALNRTPNLQPGVGYGVQSGRVYLYNGPNAPQQWTYLRQDAPREQSASPQVGGGSGPQRPAGVPSNYHFDPQTRRWVP